MKGAKQKVESWSGIFKMYSANILFYGIMVLIPLYMENGYLNLTQAKAHALYITFLPAVAMFGIAVFCAGKEKNRVRSAWDIRAFDFIVIGFAAVSCISALCSKNVRESFWGNAGWSVGAGMMLSLVAVYIIVSSCYRKQSNTWLVVLAVNIQIFLITVFHSMGIDIFGVHADIDIKQYYLYVSTVGNVNWLSGYLCLVLPVFLCFF